MRQIINALLGATALSIACVGGALAADMPVKAPVYSTPVAYNWTGFYAGGNIGGAWGTSKYSFLPSGAWLPENIAPLSADGAANLNMSGVSGGVQAGYNWQVNSFVFGAEADFQYIGLRKTSTFTQTGIITNLTTPYTFTQISRSDWLATVRGRLGFAADRVLFYGTGGLAIADSQSSDNLNFPTSVVGSTGTRSGTQLGWTAGGGAEWAFSDRWTIKAEYLYARFGTTTTVMPPITTTLLQSYTDRLTVSVGRVGMNYRF
jgi:outer membrane immunogenic protein